MIRNFKIMEPELLKYRGCDIELAFSLENFWKDIEYGAYFSGADFGHLRVSTTDPRTMDVIRLTHERDEDDDWGEHTFAFYRSNHPSGFQPRLCHEQLQRLFGRVPHRLYAWRVK